MFRVRFTLLAHPLRAKRRRGGLMFCCCFKNIFLVIFVKPIISTSIRPIFGRSLVVDERSDAIFDPSRDVAVGCGADVRGANVVRSSTAASPAATGVNS